MKRLKYNHILKPMLSIMKAEESVYLQKLSIDYYF